MIDLRSDTATRPTEAMLAAMAHAEVGSYAAGDDPEADHLEREAAAVLGQEASLFVPTATMANLIALVVHLRPGEGFVTSIDSHVMVAEAGGAAAVAGVTAHGVDASQGVLDPSGVRSCFKDAKLRTGLIWIENTHTRGGGVPTDPDLMSEYRGIAQRYGAYMHVDGARLINAAAHLGVPMHRLAATADSVTLSLNKALGAPVGAVLAGSASFIDQAREARLRLGGFWRKPGNLAAAGTLALRTPIETIQRDHAVAQRLSAELRKIPECTAEPPPTNIVIARFADGSQAAALKDHLLQQGILVGVKDASALRMVTHYSVDDRAVDHVVGALHEMAGPAALSVSSRDKSRHVSLMARRDDSR